MTSGLPEFSYDNYGHGYTGFRGTDPHIAKFIDMALGSAKTILNVGAGAGSYEPENRYVVAVEPSEVMRAQRPEHRVPAIRGLAESLPFDDGAFDASMAVMTVHHWPDPAAGLREMRRVTRGPVLVLTFDPDAETEFWMFDYSSEMEAVERRRYTAIKIITDALGGSCESQPVPMPRDCVDGYQVAFYARPEAFLNPEVRKSQSAWKFLSRGEEDRIVRSIAADLESGAWDRRYGPLRSKPFIDCQLRLVVGQP